MNGPGESTPRCISRRRALRALAGAGVAGLGAPALLRRAHAAQKLVVADPGGPFTKAFAEAFYKPFARKTGIEVVGIARASNPSSEVKAIVESRSYSWDVVSIASDIAKLLRGQNLLEPIDISGPDFAEIPDDMKSEHWMGTDVYSFVICYRTDVYGQNGPRGFADVWDVKKFPGRRALRKFPRDTIEAALRADGVPGGPEIYKVLGGPGGWDRAFRTLDRIKPHVNLWWTSSAQTTQVLKTGEMDVCLAFNARAQAAIDAGGPVRIEWNEGFYGVEGWSIPRGAPRADLGRQFIRFCAQAERQAAFTEWLAYGPTNLGAYKHINPRRAALLPTAPENFRKTTAVNDEFWSKHKDRAVERFNEWLLS